MISPDTSCWHPCMPADRFSELVNTQYLPLYRFALDLTKNVADARDLAQQTFLIWAQKGTQLRDATKAKSWLFTTLHREFLRHRRHNRRVFAWETLPAAVAEPEAPVTDLALTIDAVAAVEALQQIEDDYRIPLTLFYLESRSYKEIARLTRAPIGTVMTRLYRGKACLRHVLTRRESAKVGR